MKAPWKRYEREEHYARYERDYTFPKASAGDESQ